MNANALRRVGYQFIQLVNIHFRKKTLSFKKRHSWGREWKIEEVLPVQTSRFCELYWTFLKISVSLSREDKRGSHLGSLQKFCNIFFFTSLPNKSILSNSLSMTLSFSFPWTYPNFFISISSRSQDSKGWLLYVHLSWMNHPEL